MPDTKDKLLQGFNRMVDDLYAAVEKAEETLSPTVEEMMKNAENLSKKAYALTQDEAKVISQHLKREIAHARKYLNTDGHELKQWLNFDIQQVEDRFVDFISKAADKTWLDFRQFEQETEQHAEYRTGEICTPGTLRCLECGQTMKFTRTTRIPPCPKCHHTRFERIVK